MDLAVTHPSPALLKAIFDHSLTNIYAAQALRDTITGKLIDFQIYACNPVFRDRVGYPESELYTQTLRTLFPVLDDTGFFERYRQVVETGEAFEGEQEYSRPDGVVWYQTAVKKFEDGIVVNFTDITPYKQAREQARQAAELLQTTLDASISSILAMTAIRDQRGQIVDFRMDKANRSVERSLGRQPQELEGHRLLELFPGNVENGFFALYAKAADTGESQQATLHYTDVNGFEGWFEISAIRHKQDQLVLTFMNVTESKQVEQQLRESNASLDQFASIASHDLQEPLRKIKSFGDMLLDEYGSQLGQGTVLLHRMQAAAERMRSLIRDLLSYSRLAKADARGQEPVDMTQLVSEVLMDLDLMVAEKRAVVDVSELPTLSGDALQLRQLFQNLFTNALKFSKPGQSAQLTVSCQRLERVDPGEGLQLSSQPYWKINVSDNGIGFDEMYREKIFMAFERLHGRNSPYSGTGIGLAIVRKVMDNHQGLVIAHSQPGVGSTFSLYFPTISSQKLRR